MKKIQFRTQLKRASHKEMDVVAIHFPKNENAVIALKSIRGLQFSRTLGCWYAPYSNENMKNIVDTMKQFGFVDYKGVQWTKQPVELSLHKSKSIVSPEIAEQIELFRRWMTSASYSANTVQTYTEALRVFLVHFVNKPIQNIDNQDLINFNNDYILQKGLSQSYQNQIINGIKLYFKQVQRSAMDPNLIRRPRPEKNLPNVLSKEEVKAILNALGNLKHRTMLSLIYSCGLRRGELLKLKLQDIDSKRNLVLIRQAKGKKDRVLPLSMLVLDMLCAYFVAYKPQYWLFEGQTAGEPYSEKSLQSVLKLAIVKAKIHKPITLHWLRHSYATHLLESGTDLRYIQELLGHNSRRTTKIYTHVSTKNIQNIRSPFDDL